MGKNKNKNKKKEEKTIFKEKSYYRRLFIFFRTIIILWSSYVLIFPAFIVLYFYYRKFKSFKIALRNSIYEFVWAISGIYFYWMLSYGSGCTLEEQEKIKEQIS